MSKLAKVILAVFAGAVVVLAVALLLLNIYVQSAGVQRLIELRLSEALNVPVQIKRTSVTPLGGLTLAGVTISSEEPEAPLLESQSVSANLRVLPLLTGRLIIDEIALNSPVVVWRQKDGKWQLPELPPPVESAPADPPEGDPTPSATPAERASPAEMEAVPETTPALAAEPERVGVKVQQLRIADGKFAFLNEDGTEFMRLDGVNVVGTISPEGDIAGEADTAALSFSDRYALTELKAPFSYRGDTLEIPSLTARTSDGTVRGNFRVETVEEETPFEMKLDFEDVNLARLLTRAGVSTVRAAGTMSGFLELEGSARNRKDLEGRGSISVQNGQVDQYPLLQVIGRALRVDELDQMKLATAEARFTIDRGNILVDSLVLISQNIQLDAKGQIQRDNDLKLDARLTLSPAITRQLPELIEGNFEPVEGSDRRYLDFEIGGTVEKPKTNLVEMALGRRLKEEALDLFKNLWN